MVGKVDFELPIRTLLVGDTKVPLWSGKSSFVENCFLIVAKSKKLNAKKTINIKLLFLNVV